jgi:hypothetical protein
MIVMICRVATGLQIQGWSVSERGWLEEYEVSIDTGDWDAGFV